MDYDALLNRGKDELPEKVEGHDRFIVPAAKVTQLGKKTLVANFGDICSKLNRDPDVVAKYLLRELGTAGSRSEGRITLNGIFSAEAIDAAIAKYVENFVHVQGLSPAGYATAQRRKADLHPVRGLRGEVPDERINEV